MPSVCIRSSCGALLALSLSCLPASTVLVELPRPPNWASVTGDVYQISLSSPDGLRVFANHSAYTPLPDFIALKKTDAARKHQDGLVIIGFCIDTQGNTTAAVIQGFPGDPAIDEIVLRAVDDREFYPFRVDGKRVVVCGEYKFKLKFH